MNQTVDDGGPAYPIPLQELPNGDSYGPEPGMSLRDWIAATALAGMLANPNAHDKHDWAEKLSVCAYDAADAMLKRRNES